MLDKEILQGPSGVEVHRLQFDSPKAEQVSSRLIEIYNDPTVRFHLVAPPQSREDLVRDAEQGYQVLYARDATGELSDTPDRVVGAVTLIPADASTVHDASIVEVARLAVAPEATRRGVGTKLLNHALDMVFAGRAKEAGLGILADVPGWEDVRKLYARHGFVDQLEYSRIIPVRDLGTVQEVQSPPFPAVRIGVDGQKVKHFVSLNVPMLAMGLPRNAYLARRRGG